MPLFRKKPSRTIDYDPQTRQPAVRRSICTGEMTVGFIDLRTGRFIDYMRADGQKGLEDFCRATGIDPDDIRTIY